MNERKKKREIDRGARIGKRQIQRMGKGGAHCEWKKMYLDRHRAWNKAAIEMAALHSHFIFILSTQWFECFDLFYDENDDDYDEGIHNLKKKMVNRKGRKIKIGERVKWMRIQREMNGKTKIMKKQTKK